MSTLKFEQLVKAPAATVYRAFTNSTAIKEWLCDVATLDPHPGGRLYLWWINGYYTVGEFISVIHEKEIIFTWRGRPETRATKVRVTFKHKRGSTLVRITHSNIGSGPQWVEATKEFTKGWQYGLENLVSTLEQGPDLRITRRPMLGINIGDFDHEVAKKLGVPVTEGLRLDGVVEGMGAKAAGLQKDDVLVSMDGTDTSDFSRLASFMNGKRAGDQVEVIYYRSAEKQTTKMTLSGRPIPVIPATARELAQTTGKAYGDMEDNLDAFLKGVSEAQASFKPSPEEWSIKEVMAHLIHSERGWQNILGEMIGGHEGYYDGFGGNPPARVAATLAAFPTIADLLTELKRLNVETLVTLAHLPKVFVARKSSYWRLAFQMQQIPYHFQVHMEQMQAALESAKK